MACQLRGGGTAGAAGAGPVSTVMAWARVEAHNVAKASVEKNNVLNIFILMPPGRFLQQ